MKAMKSLTKLALALLTAGVCATFSVQAQTDSSTATNSVSTNAAPVAPRRVRAPRFTGIIETVDATAMTLTLKGRSGETTVKVTSTTKISKNRQPALFSDAVVGLRVSGTGKKEDDGTWVATTLAIRNPPIVAPAAPAAAAPAAPPAGSSDQKPQ